MAKVLYTAVVADMRNKLNGSVFSKNRYGAYVRTKVTPVNPRTTAQQNARNILATWSAGWRSITQAQRNGWIAAAPNFPFTDVFGNIKFLSGNALYVKLNANLNYAGVAGIDDAPTPTDIPAITALTLTATGGGTPALSMVFAPTPVPAGYALIVKATPNIPQSRLFISNQFRNIKVVAAAGTSPNNLLTAYAAVFGNPVTGNRITVQAFYISTTTGQAGIPLQAEDIV